MRRLPFTSTFQQARNPTLITASAVLGVVVAVLVALFEMVSLHTMLAYVKNQNIVVVALTPALGILLARAVLTLGGRNVSNATSDEYVRAFHERHPNLPIGELPVKLLAGIVTIGSGGSVGLEGTCMYAGSSIGLFTHERMSRFFRKDEARILLTAGAAAGVTAVFKTPATGVIFAMEAPYNEDVTSRALIPSLIASATSYIALVALLGSEPVVPFLTDGLVQSSEPSSVWIPSIRLEDLRGAVILGLIAGIAGRCFAWMVQITRQFSRSVSWRKRATAATLGLAGLAILSDAYLGKALSLGTGIEAMEWVFNEESLAPMFLLLCIRICATLTTIYGGGVGGLFIPLCTLGVIVGQIVGVGIVGDTTGLYPTLGLAAFLGGGYRTPIAAVMFVAESTHGVGAFVVPALIAAAVSQVVSGSSTVVEHKRSRRMGHLESRFTLPISSIINTDIFTVPPDATVSEFIYVHVLGRRERTVPVVSDMTYLGMAKLDNVQSNDRDSWSNTLVESIMTTSPPIALPSWTLRDAVVAMDNAGTNILAVTDNHGNFIGVVTEDDVVKLGEILDQTES